MRDGGNFVGKLQESFANESDRIIASKKPEDKKETPPADSLDDDTAGGSTLSKYFKDKHNIELSDEEILERIKGVSKADNGSSSGSAPVSFKAPALEEINDDEVGAFLDAEYDKKREPLTRFSANQKKVDLDLVKESLLPALKEKFKDLDDVAIEDRFNERFYISDDDTFSASEKAYGQELLAAEAKRLRDQDGVVVESARRHLHNNKLKEYNNKLHAAKVDDFIKTAPSKVTFEFGKTGSKELGSYEFDVAPEIVAEVTQIMKNPEKLLDLFKGEAGQSLDLQKMYKVLIDLKTADAARKSIASHYHTQGVEEVEQKLHNNPDLGKLGSSKGKLTEATKEAETANKNTLEKNIGRSQRRRQ